VPSTLAKTNRYNADTIPSPVNVLATIWLISWPASILLRMKLCRRVKRALLMAFGSALLLFASEIFHCVNLMLSINALLPHSGRIEVRQYRVHPIPIR
jgi:hypothetical protein